MKTYFSVGMIISILIIFSTCKGQSNSDTIQKEISQKTIGEIVPKLDSKATLIYQDSNNNYWFGSKDKGVYKYDGENIVRFTSSDGLCGHRVLSIQEDNNGGIYFDTSEGVCKFDGQQFTTLKVIESDTEKHEWKLEPNDLWFRMGWDKSGPYRYDGKNLYHLEFPKNKMEDEFYAKYPNASYNPYGIYSMYKDSKGKLWFGTSNLGIYTYDGNKISWMYEQHLTETPSGGAFGIRSIFEDRDGYFWISNTNYKYKILPDTIESLELCALKYNREIGMKNNINEVSYFMSITEDKNGLWMASNTDGVWLNNGKELKHYPNKDGDKEIFATSIYKDNLGVLWLGTHENGMFKFNGESFEKFRL